jgi:hypothetical protein
MNWTVIDRRQLLAAFGGGLLATLAAPVLARAGERTLLLSAYATGGTGDPVYGVAALDPSGKVVFATPLPGRAHAVVPHPTRAEAIVFARRPGRWFVPVSLPDGTPGPAVTVPDDRRFTGHGAFYADGRLLYVPEDDIPNEVGAIGVYDVTDGYRRLGAMPTHGVGPHELVALDGGRVLAVANGGVITHPDTGRAKLNLDSIDASLTYVDAANGRLLEAVRLPEEHANLGIRHLAPIPGGVVFGVQDERPTGELQPLVWVHRRGEAPKALDLPEEELTRFDGYIGSIAANHDTAAASSPRGGLIGLWNTTTGQWLGATPLPDGCGIAALGHGFLATSGFGTCALVDAGKPGADSAQTVAGFRWDNHITPVG